MRRGGGRALTHQSLPSLKALASSGLWAPIIYLQVYVLSGTGEKYVVLISLSGPRSGCLLPSFPGTPLAQHVAWVPQ